MATPSLPRGASLSRRHFLGSGLAAAVAIKASATTPSGQQDRALATIPARLQSFVDSGSIAGAVSLVQQHGRILRIDSVGWRDVASRSPMHEDTVFQIMSQAKPYIATSIMLLHERGLLNVNDPVENYLPEFKGMWLIDAEGDGRRVLRRPGAVPTIFQLISHSAGLPDAAPATQQFATKMRYTLAEITAILSQQPLEAQPGTRWRYSNQGIAAAARVVEVVSGLDYREFVRRNIFEPLAMKDAVFTPSKKQIARLASVYDLKEGKLTEMGPGTPGFGDLKLRKGVAYSMPEAGIFTTAREAARLHQVFLDGGRWEGQRLLSPQSVQLMLTPHIAMGKFGSGQAWQGLGWRLEPNKPRTPSELPAGSFHHSGALGSFGWGDPGRGIVGILLLQRPGANAERDAVIGAVNAAFGQGETGF